MMIVFMALFVLSRLDRSGARTYFTATGTVQEARIVVDHTVDNEYGGQIHYRIEARVHYMVEGQEQDRWLTASEAMTERGLLVEELEPPPQTCLVYWVPRHPENARCRLK